MEIHRKNLLPKELPFYRCPRQVRIGRGALQHRGKFVWVCRSDTAYSILIVERLVDDDEDEPQLAVSFFPSLHMI